MRIMINRNGTNDGFALLLTLLVVSVTLAIGLTLLNITVTQQKLSVTARDSERAFHAAQTGLDCATIARNDNEWVTNTPDEVEFACVEERQTASVSSVNSDRTHIYEQTFDWSDNGNDFCTEVELYVLDATGGEYTHTFQGKGIDDKECPAGSICTVIFSRGYNTSCNNFDSDRIVQRELTAQF